MVIITVAGDPGSGKSTLAKQLAQELGLPHISAGDLFKQLARELDLTEEELSHRAEEDPELWEKKIDPYQEQLPGKHDAFVIDSRLGFHFIPKSVKMYVKCSFREAAHRMFDARKATEGWKTIDEGASALKARQESEKKRYQKLYGVDHTDTSQFDIVIDSTSTTPKEKLDQALKALRSYL